MAFVVSHMIWLRRNAVVFGCDFTNPGKIVVEVKHVVQEFTQATMSAALSPRWGNGSAVTWTPPLDGTPKINWAICIDHETQRTGIGVLSRDASGDLLATQEKFISS